MAKTAALRPIEVDVVALQRGEATFWLVGESDYFCNRMAAKSQRELLMPRGKLTTTQRATRLKHAPYAEFRNSVIARRGGGATKLMMLGSAPKRAAAGAALRMPSGVTRTEINALLSVPTEYCELWGVPRLDMSVVRQAGMSRTPDIRTRARLSGWAARVTYRWTKPMLTETAVTTLVVGGGLVCGLGDWRIEKGGSFGGYRVAAADDPELVEIMRTGGYAAQEEALANPVCSNSESEELLAWYLDELAHRGLKPDDETTEEIEVALDDFPIGDEQPSNGAFANADD